MNHDQFEKLLYKIGGDTPSLSDAERAKMRGVLREYAAFKPAIAPTPSPYYPYKRILGAFSTLANSRAAYAFTAFLVLGLTSVSVTSAAEGALPGDALYGVKVDVIEPVRIALASSAEGKIAWERVFAERRLTEAAALADQGRLDPSVEATLAANFEHYASVSLKQPVTREAAADTLSMSMSVAESESDLPSEDFSARLAAHEAVLTEIDAKRGKEATRTLRSLIQSHTARSAETDDTAEVDEPQLARLKVATDVALTNSAALVTALSPSVATATTERAQQALREAEAYRSEGEALLKKNDARGASRALKNSLKAAARLQVFTNAAATLKIDAFAPMATSSTAVTATTSATTTTPSDTPTEEGHETATSTSAAAPEPQLESSTRSFIRSKLGF